MCKECINNPMYENEFESFCVDHNEHVCDQCGEMACITIEVTDTKHIRGGQYRPSDYIDLCEYCYNNFEREMQCNECGELIQLWCDYMICVPVHHCIPLDIKEPCCN